MSVVIDLIILVDKNRLVVPIFCTRRVYLGMYRTSLFIFIFHGHMSNIN